ncbi:hypothetical protein LO763_17790 [Glycomyces sp. A-F 0318]|uniref:hypothetical protein n=1 Tax=Glycomyces amatae TaxID=2881355 RepID=UPI001E50A28F|nr:hypothetical protein [Glycomyces amatae]MCD0445467.1 hypothetical protein [Glycomyces amatae]
MEWESTVATSVEDAIEALRRMERELPDYFELEPGATDAELTEADPLLPDDVRALLRVTTGVRVRGRDEVVFDPRRTAIGSEWMWGPGDSTRVICSLGTGDHFFVDRDPGTGAWGAVFSQSADYFDAWVYCAGSLPEFLVDWAEQALARAAAGDEGFDVCFPFEDVWNLKGALAGTRVGDLRGTGDAELAEALEALPDDAVLADLRGLEPPVKMDMKGEGEFRRCGAQRLFAVATPE